jgi:hypothetical protein
VAFQRQEAAPALFGRGWLLGTEKFGSELRVDAAEFIQRHRLHTRS